MIIIHFSPAKLFLLTVGIAHMIMKYRKFALVICVPHVLNIMINGSYTSPDMNSECIFKNNLPILPEWLYQNIIKMGEWKQTFICPCHHCTKQSYQTGQQRSTSSKYFWDSMLGLYHISMCNVLFRYMPSKMSPCFTQKVALVAVERLFP